MPDKKYIPIIAAALLILAIAGLAYYLYLEQRARKQMLPGAVPPALLEALNAPGGEVITNEELDELRNSLFAPSGGNGTGGGINVLYEALSVPVQ
jgi:hypothetical protein